MKDFLNKNKTIKQIKNWYQDRYETVLIQRNVLFALVVALVVIFGFTIINVLKLNSEKVYEPFIVQIEENTGIITKVDNSQVRQLPAEKAVRNASIVRYVLARESYNIAEFNFNYYQVVRLMSSEEVYKQFRGFINPDNRESPISLGFQNKIEAKVKSLIELDEKTNLIQIRLSKTKMPTIGAVNERDLKEQNYIITLEYQYRSLNLSETERFINPLGIQITKYNISEEQSARKI